MTLPHFNLGAVLTVVEQLLAAHRADAIPLIEALLDKLPLSDAQKAAVNALVESTLHS